MISNKEIATARNLVTNNLNQLRKADELTFLNRADTMKILATLAIADALVYVGDSINATRTSGESVQHPSLGLIK